MGIAKGAEVNYKNLNESFLSLTGSSVVTANYLFEGTVSIGDAIRFRPHNDSTIGSDVYFVSDGTLSSEGSMIFMMDSDNDSGVEKFIWKTNTEVDPGGSTLMVLQEDGNVGIGTTNPVGALSFGFRGAVISPDTVDAADNKYIILCGGGGSANTRGGLVLVGGNEDALYAGQVVINPGSTAGMQVKIDSTMYIGDGNVGIGTESPGVWKLNVNGTARITGSLYVDQDIVHTDDTNTYMRFTPDTINFTTAGTARLTILADGDIDTAAARHVGIAGSHSNSYSLYVNGNTYMNGTANVAGLITGTVTNANNLQNLPAASFIRSDVADTVTSGYTRWNDNVEIEIGTGGRFKMWANGNNTYMKSYTHGGDVYTSAETTAGASYPKIDIYGDGGVELYHLNQSRLSTTSTGVTINGALNVTGLITGTITGDADTVDNLHGWQFIRSDVSDTVTATYTRWADEKEIQLGTSGDFRMKFTGTATRFFSSWPGGSFLLSGNNVSIEEKSMFTADPDAAVQLFHAGSAKFTTASYGAYVTGQLGFSSAGRFGAGTTTGDTFPLSYNGYFYATRVYNAVYNDLAEFMPYDKTYEPVAGMVMVQKDGLLRISSKRADRATIGVYSDTFGFALGSENEEDKVPIGLAGKVKVRIRGTVKEGDELVSYGGGKAVAANLIERLFKRNCIIGKSLENGKNEKVWMLIK